MKVRRIKSRFVPVSYLFMQQVRADLSSIEKRLYNYMRDQLIIRPIVENWLGSILPRVEIEVELDSEITDTEWKNGSIIPNNLPHVPIEQIE